MKIYLSEYWRKNSIFILCLALIIVILTGAFCLWNRGAENYILIGCALGLILILAFVQMSTFILLDYVEMSDNEYIMFSVGGKRKCTVKTDEHVYFQILSLVEGSYSRQDFIVLSNEKFTFYKDGSGLAKVYKKALADGNQIVMPYNKTTQPLLKF